MRERGKQWWKGVKESEGVFSLQKFLALAIVAFSFVFIN
jgi:hypothetical protein